MYVDYRYLVPRNDIPGIRRSPGTWNQVPGTRYQQSNNHASLQVVSQTKKEPTKTIIIKRRGPPQSFWLVDKLCRLYNRMGSVYQDGAVGGAPPTGDDGKMIDLSLKFDMSECYARNEAAGYPMTNLFIGDTRLGCKSDADEQLILHISFQEFVKVRSIFLG